MAVMEKGSTRGCLEQRTTHSPDLGVTATCFGRPRNCAIGDWGDIENFVFMARQAGENGIKNLWIPRPTNFNAEIAGPNQFEQVWDIDGVLVHTGIMADGVELLPDEGFWISSGDCPTLVVMDKDSNRVIATHAGRDCLIDRGEILRSRPTRTHRSVVDVIWNRLEPENPRAIQAWVYCGIGPEGFSHDINHPEHGEDNQTLINWLVKHYGTGVFAGPQPQGQLRLHQLIRKQFWHYGVTPRQVKTDHVDTWGDLNELTGKPAWWSRRRGDSGRNGVLVTRQ